MKKGFLFLLVFSIFFPSFTQNLPESYYGIWEGKDRFVFFEQVPEDKNQELVVLLKEYYGWWVDRTAEPEKFTQKENRSRNSGTTRTATSIGLEYPMILQKDDCAYGEFKLTYSKNQINYVPFCILNNKMYLDFHVRSEENPQVYIGNSISQGILVSEQRISEKLSVLVVDENKLFDIRYWKTDMEFSSEKAKFSWENKEYEVPVHIKSGDVLYTCVNGRSRKIRNLQPPTEVSDRNFIYNSDKSLLIKDSSPYLVQLVDKKTFEDLIQIVKENNSKRKPDPPAIFPPANLDWHWDIIELLEKDNRIIQEVRKRQKDFGPRAH